VTARAFQEHVCPAVGCPGRNSRKPGPVGADLPSVREEAGCFFWVIQQSMLLDVAQESRLSPSGDVLL